MFNILKKLFAQPPLRVTTVMRHLKGGFQWIPQPNEFAMHGKILTVHTKTNKLWYGDCDDFAATACDRLYRDKPKQAEVWYIVFQKKDKTYHAVAAYSDSGKFDEAWVLDNESKYPYTVHRLKNWKYRYSWPVTEFDGYDVYFN